MADKVTITTAQNVQLEYHLATAGNRILATLIDIAVLMAYSIIINLLISDIYRAGGSAMYVIGTIVSIPMLFYSFIFEQLLNGQTAGKKALNIKVVSMNGDPMTMSQYLLRWMFRIVDIWLAMFFALPGMIAIGSIVIGQKGQRLGDKAADSTVISLRPKRIISSKTAYAKVNEQYEMKYPQASRLHPEDVMAIKEIYYLQGRSAYAVKSELAEKLEQVLQIKRDQNVTDFLVSIVRDYNYHYQLDMLKKKSEFKLNLGLD